MSSTAALSAGVQQIYNAGLLPSNMSTSALAGASTDQLNKMAATTIASQEVSALLGTGGDTASLSPTATSALLQEINPSSSTSTSSSTTTDPLTAAVDNALTSSLNAAVSKFTSPSSSASGGNINVVG